MRHIHRGECIIAVLGCLVAAGSVHAQSAPRGSGQSVSADKADAGSDGDSRQACEDERPWYCGVSEEQRASALRLYEEGNYLLDNAYFKEAAGKYRVALEHWDHPSIHYNLMLAMIGLERPIEAYASSTEALRHGDSALTAEQLHRTRQNQQMLLGQFSWIDIACDEPGAVVSLDGQVVLEAPGRIRRLVMPGQHEVVASKKDHLTVHKPLLILPRKPMGLEFDMLHKDEAVLVQRRWAEWKPWLVVGAGASLGIVGGVVQWRASVNNRRYQELFTEECEIPNGCFPDDYSANLRSLELRSTWYRRGSYGAYAIGGAAVMTGLVLAYMNIPRRWENPRRNKLVRAFELSSEVRPDGGSISINAEF